MKIKALIVIFVLALFYLFIYSGILFTLSWHVNYFASLLQISLVWHQLTLLHKPITTAYQIIYDGMITYNVYILRRVTFSKQAYSFEASNNSECLLNSFIMVPWYDKKLSSRFLCKTN